MEEAGEFQDWEMLQNSPVSVESSTRHFEGIEGDSEGVIKSDYFTLDSEKRYPRTVAKGDLWEESSVDSNNPSWVDPFSEPRYGDEASREVGLPGMIPGRKISSEFWSDSGSDQSVSQKFSDFEEKTVLGFGNDAKIDVGFGEFGGTEAKNKDSGELKFEDEGEAESGLGNYENATDELKFPTAEEGAIGLDSVGFVVEESNEASEEIGNLSAEEVTPGEEEKGKMVWWKLPLELLKFYVFRAKPIWSISIAAAVMGFIILGRRLYNMRRKSRGIRLKVTVEDKKVSQFMIRAARLNEAFSVVRRVPTVRPSLPVGGVTPWPVMSLR